MHITLLVTLNEGETHQNSQVLRTATLGNVASQLPDSPLSSKKIDLIVRSLRENKKI